MSTHNRIHCSCVVSIDDGGTAATLNLGKLNFMLRRCSAQRNKQCVQISKNVCTYRITFSEQCVKQGYTLIFYKSGTGDSDDNFSLPALSRPCLLPIIASCLKIDAIQSSGTVIFSIIKFS